MIFKFHISLEQAGYKPMGKKKPQYWKYSALAEFPSSRNPDTLRWLSVEGERPTKEEARKAAEEGADRLARSEYYVYVPEGQSE